MCACFTVHEFSHNHVYVVGTCTVDTYDGNSTHVDIYRPVDVEYKMNQYLCEDQTVWYSCKCHAHQYRGFNGYMMWNMFLIKIF